jgi:hypothetical protein
MSQIQHPAGPVNQDIPAANEAVERSQVDDINHKLHCNTFKQDVFIHRKGAKNAKV